MSTINSEKTLASPFVVAVGTVGATPSEQAFLVEAGLTISSNSEFAELMSANTKGIATVTAKKLTSQNFSASFNLQQFDTEILNIFLGGTRTVDSDDIEQIRFDGTNPALKAYRFITKHFNGQIIDFQFPRARVSENGEFGAANEFLAMSITVTNEVDLADEDSYPIIKVYPLTYTFDDIGFTEFSG